MDLDNAIISRKSVRKYLDKDISDDIVEKLIESARLAPSAKNRQPWRYMIVRGEVKNNIADIMTHQLTKEKTNLSDRYCPNNSVNTTALAIKQAPILILVFRNKDDNWIIGDTLSIGASIEHICLKATDLGLGSLWIRDTVFSKNEISDYVGKKDMELVCAIAIGYSNDISNSPKKKNLNEIMEWY